MVMASVRHAEWVARANENRLGVRPGYEFQGSAAGLSRRAAQNDVTAGFFARIQAETSCVDQRRTFRFSADVLPRSEASSNSMGCPSLRRLRPARSTAERGSTVLSAFAKLTMLRLREQCLPLWRSISPGCRLARNRATGRRSKLASGIRPEFPGDTHAKV